MQITELWSADTQKRQQLIRNLQKKPVVEVAELLSSLEGHTFWEILSYFTPEQQGLLFAELDTEKQLELVELIAHKNLSDLLSYMPSDARVDLFQNLPPERQRALLPYLPKPIRENILSLSLYPPDTAGGIMSTDFAAIFPHMTASQAIEKIRYDAPSRRTIYYTYVVDNDMHLLGFVTLRDLILADPSLKVETIMHTEYIAAHVEEDPESVATKIAKYDLVAIPIINDDHQLVGIITHDQALDVVQAEQTEDIQKFMGILPQQAEDTYLQLPVWKHFWRRIVWLVPLALAELVAGWVVHSYEALLSQVYILALYMPMIAATGGDCGGQSATLIIRAMSLGEISVRDTLRILFKETRTGLMIALVLGLVAYLKILFLTDPTSLPAGLVAHQIGLVVSLALGLQALSSTLLGALLPILAQRFGFDPAAMAAPFITTMVDATGLFIYFYTASLFLPLS
ncbi:MAG: magnesium transporter [Bacteroidia bacterium]